MSLENLLKIGQLKLHPQNRDEIHKLLDAATRNLKDSGNTSNGVETRFDCAYKAVMQSSLAALMANGYRPSTSVPGHQMTMIQALTLTIGVKADRMMVLDALRKKRNLNDYVGTDLDEETAAACAREATRLLADVRGWLKVNRPELA